MTLHGVIQLLDSAHGRPLQNWKIQSDDRVTIGRAPTNDIVVADPFVSRAHAYIDFDDERQRWCMTSISHLKLVFEDRAQTQVDLVEGGVYRLGAQGCFLRFQQSIEHLEVDNRQTVAGDFVRPALVLDQNKLAADVSEIVDGDFFQTLKQAADRHRNRRDSSNGEPSTRSN
jgi:hypothetical protein